MPALSDPLLLPCGATLNNRLAKSAMSEDLADPGHLPGERLNRLYARWGAGGAGLLITGNVMIDKSALGEPHNVVIDGDTPPGALRAWAAAGQAGGARMWTQLNHPGRQSPRILSKVPVAPSAVPLKLPGGAFARPRALTAEEIEAIIARFAGAARVCKEAGFAGVQVHGAHGYLVSQFLSPLSNLREDDWGGDPARRRRFLLEIVRAIRAAVGPEFPVGVKLNSADFQRGGFTEEESMAVVELLESEGVDLLEVSGGTYERPAMVSALPEQKESTRQREAYFLEYARKVRARTKMPLMLTGGLRTRAGLEAALAEGVDVLGMARPFALEPEIARGLLEGSVNASAVEPQKTGIKAIDGFVETIWAGWQLARMAEGEDPDPGASPWRVIAAKLWSAMRG